MARQGGESQSRIAGEFRIREAEELQRLTMIPATLVEEIQRCVRTGSYDQSDLSEHFMEDLEDWGVSDEAALEAALQTAWTAFAAEQLTWPETTDCDRLDRAFAAMSGLGVLALQDAGYTQSDGYGDCCEALGEHPHPDRVLGYCFYHGQDTERAVDGGGLYLAFGPMDPKNEKAKGPVVGAIVRDALQQAGFDVTWNGSFDQRIHVPKVVWQRRTTR